MKYKAEVKEGTYITIDGGKLSIYNGNYAQHGYVVSSFEKLFNLTPIEEPMWFHEAIVETGKLYNATFIFPHYILSSEAGYRYHSLDPDNRFVMPFDLGDADKKVWLPYRGDSS